MIHQRLRCFGHIINLSAKAFLFGEDPDAFELEIDNLEKLKLEVRYERELLAQWRKRGSIGKLHNIVVWIRRTLQRRDSFMELSRDHEPMKSQLSTLLLPINRILTQKGLIVVSDNAT